MLMLYVKLIVFITQHQDVTCSARLYKGQQILNLSGTAHFSHVQIDQIVSHPYFMLLFLWLQKNMLWALLIPKCKYQRLVLSQAYHTITQKS